MSKLDSVVEEFQSLEPELRLELLLEYAQRLPPLPERYHQMRDAGLHRVVECQSPVFVFLEAEDGRLRFHADAPENAPTVRGFVTILAEALDGQPLEAAAALPADLLHRLGIAQKLGMTRTHGLDAVLRRVKREAAEMMNG